MVNSEQVNPGWINDVLYLSFFIVNLEYMGPNLPKKSFKVFGVRDICWKRGKPIIFLDIYNVWENPYSQTITSSLLDQSNDKIFDLLISPGRDSASKWTFIIRVSTFKVVRWHLMHHRNPEKNEFNLGQRISFSMFKLVQNEDSSISFIYSIRKKAPQSCVKKTKKTPDIWCDDVELG